MLNSVASAVGPALFGKILNATGNSDVADYFGLNTTKNLQAVKEEVAEVKELLGTVSEQVSDLSGQLESVGDRLESWTTLTEFQSSYGSLSSMYDDYLLTLEKLAKGHDDQTMSEDEYHAQLNSLMETIYDSNDYRTMVLSMGDAIMGAGTSLVSPTKAYYQNRMQVDGVTRDQLKQDYLDFCTSVYQDYVMSVMLCNGSMVYLAEQQGGNSLYEIQIDALSKQSQQVSVYLYNEWQQLFPSDSVDGYDDVLAGDLTADDYVVEYTDGKPTLTRKSEAVPKGELWLSDYALVMDVGEGTGIRAFHSEGGTVYADKAESSNPDVAVVDKWGGIFATGVGSCTITFEYKGASAQARIEVMNLSSNASVITSITGEMKDISGDTSGKTYALDDLVAAAAAKANQADSVADASLYTWESLDEQAVKINGGNVEVVGNSSGYALVIGTRQVRYDTRFNQCYQIEKIVLPFFIEYGEPRNQIYDYDDLINALYTVSTADDFASASKEPYSLKANLTEDTSYGRICDEAKLRFAYDIDASGASGTLTLNGENHTIDLLGTPLFSKLSNGRVSDLTAISNDVMSGGAIAHELTTTAAVENCTVNVDIVSDSQYVGGVVDESKGRIAAVNFYGSVENRFVATSDIVFADKPDGSSVPIPRYCEITDIDWENHRTTKLATGAGGIVGLQKVSASVVNGRWQRNNDKTGVYNCYSDSSVTAQTNAGGVVGLALGAWEQEQSKGSWDFVPDVISEAEAEDINAAYVPVFASVSAGSVVANDAAGIAGGVVGYAVCAEINGASVTAKIKGGGANGRASGVAGVYAPRQYGTYLVDYPTEKVYTKQKIANVLVDNKDISAVPGNEAAHQRTRSNFYYDPETPSDLHIGLDTTGIPIARTLLYAYSGSSPDNFFTAMGAINNKDNDLCPLIPITGAEMRPSYGPDLNNGWPVFSTTREVSHAFEMKPSYEYGEALDPVRALNVAKVEYKAVDDDAFVAAEPTDVGEYIARATFADGGTLEDDFAITPRVAEFSDPDETELEYNGGKRIVQSPYVANAVGGDDVTAVVEGHTGVDVGDYELTVTGLTGADASNYAMPEGGYTMPWKIVNNDQVATSIAITDAEGNPVSTKTLHFNLESAKTLTICDAPVAGSPDAEPQDAFDLYVHIKDQNGLDYFLKENETVQWAYDGTGATLAKDETTDVLTLTAENAGEGVLRVSLGDLSAETAIDVVELTSVVRLEYDGGAATVDTNAAYDLAGIPLVATDMHQKTYELSREQRESMVWEVEKYDVQGAATIDGSTLTVGALPEGSTEAEIWLSGTLPAQQAGSGEDLGMENFVILTVREQPRLTSIEIALRDPDRAIELLPGTQSAIDEYLSVTCTDQYGDAMDPADLTWASSNTDVFDIAGNEFFDAKADGSADLTASAGGLTSNAIAVTVKSAPLLTSLAIGGAPASLACNETLALSTLTIEYLDQHGQAMASPGYPIAWSVENDANTNVSIVGGALQTGTGFGTIVLTAATGPKVTGSVEITIGPKVEGLTLSPASLGSAGGKVTATITGERLSAGITAGLFGADADPIATAQSAMDDQGACTAVLDVPENTGDDPLEYTVRISLDGGATWLSEPEATLTVVAESGSASVSAITADTTSLPSDGGKAAFTLEGDNLDAAAPLIGLFGADGSLIASAATVWQDGACTGTLDVPANETTSAVAFTVKVSLDGGATWLDSPTAALSVEAKPESGGPGGGGGGGGTTTPETHEITVVQPENGTVTLDKTSAAEGETVTVTGTPDEGYKLSDLVITDESGAGIDVTANADGTYSFTMPAGAVSIEAVFEKTVFDCDGGEGCVSNHFTDIDAAQWYHEAVDYVVAHGLMTGTVNGMFEPDLPTTRAMLVMVLYRIEGEPETSQERPFAFEDVAPGSWYEQAVAWAFETDMVQGYSPSQFGPEDSITREDMMLIMQRYAGMKGIESGEPDNLDAFPDENDVSFWAYEAMQWACTEGLIQGIHGSLEPQGDATRAQLAAILMRYCEEVMKSEDEAA